MKYYKAKVMCNTCEEEFNVLSNAPEAKNWYVPKNLPNCSHHTKDNKEKNTVHKRLRYNK